MLRFVIAGALISANLWHALAQSIQVLSTTTLGLDPQTVNRLNGESFQQDALVTFNSYQYAVFWATFPANTSVRHATVSRRALRGNGLSGSWESLTLTDYNQTEDDGHDIISLGISRGDGTLHIIFDQHDNPLHYRSTTQGVATNPTTISWNRSIFRPISDFLPGLESLDKSTHFINVTYPRFLSIPSGSLQSDADLMLEMRVGRSGLGDDWLYQYTPHRNWTLVGKYLEGVNNNAYINGLDFDSHGILHTTWTYRDFINDTGKDVAVQAGPNGPENNHDLDYSFSADLGLTWLNNWEQTVGNLSAQLPIVPISPGITVFSIPKFGGILNQEAQTIDRDGRVHILNRENATGVEQWYHYWRSTTTFWTRTPLPLDLPLSINKVTQTPTVIGKRGKLVAPPGSSSLLALLPSNAPNSTGLTILQSTATGHFRDWSVAWEIDSGCTWEPLYDRYRLDVGEAGGDGVLSLFLVNGTVLNVVDLRLSELD